MIKFEHVEVTGWEAAIRGMRNPKESWDRSDSKFDGDPDSCQSGCEGCPNVGPDACKCIGPNDLDLMKRLAKAGSDHRKYMRYLTVTVDVTAPLYWWKEFDTYKVGTVANSESTMHCVHKHEFTLDDFSCEHLIGGGEDIFTVQVSSDGFEYCPAAILWDLIEVLNGCRDEYLKLDAQIKKDPATAGMCEKRKQYWWQMIQLLPSSYNQKRTVQMNYETLANIRRSRRGHKLDEWDDKRPIIENSNGELLVSSFMEFIESLPYHELIDIAAGVKSEEEKKAERDRLAHKARIMSNAGLSLEHIAEILDVSFSKVHALLGIDNCEAGGK